MTRKKKGKPKSNAWTADANPELLAVLSCPVYRVFFFGLERGSIADQRGAVVRLALIGPEAY